MERSIRALALTVCIGLLVAPAYSQQTKDSPPPLGTASFTPPESKNREPLTPENFVVRAAVANLAEIEMSELALQKSADPGIRNYATTMLQDHKSAQTKLKHAASEEKIALPGTVDEKHRTQKEQLAEQVGAAFDAQYVSMMQTGHDQTLAMLDSATKSKELAAPLKKYATDTLIVVRRHRDDANKLKSQLQP